MHNKYKPGRRTAVISKGEETLSLFPPGSFSMGILEPKKQAYCESPFSDVEGGVQLKGFSPYMYFQAMGQHLSPQLLHRKSHIFKVRWE